VCLKSSLMKCTPARDTGHVVKNRRKRHHCAIVWVNFFLCAPLADMCISLQSSHQSKLIAHHARASAAHRSAQQATQKRVFCCAQCVGASSNASGSQFISSCCR
jgi:hypothetical protein